MLDDIVEQMMLCEELKSIEDLDKQRIWQVSQKLDGCRANLFLNKDGSVALNGRDSNDLGDKFPEIIEEAKELSKDLAEDVTLDAELIIGTTTGYWFTDNFLLLASRTHTESIPRIKLLSRYAPARLVCFDIIADSLKDASQRERTERLNYFLGRFISDARFPERRIIPIPTQEGDYKLIERLLEETRKLGLEGLVIKDATSKYEGKRSWAWRKLKNYAEEDCICTGYVGKERPLSALIMEDKEGKPKGKVNWTGQPKEIEDRILAMGKFATEDNASGRITHLDKCDYFTIKVKYLPTENYEHLRFPTLKEVMI